jgi:anti-sigma regulatory factor (Ser/Thr protein kinase)
MAATRGSADQTASTREKAAANAPEFRWRQVFPGEERQLGELRRWLAGLLPACSARDDVVSVAVELATNAVKFSRSGQGGCFAVEITWCEDAVRVAVADSGGPGTPHMIEDPVSDHGRGLVMVRALSLRTGFCGDHRGRLVWADVPWAGDVTAAPRSSPDAHQAPIHQDEAALSQCFAGVPIWFGHRTLQWTHPGWRVRQPARQRTVSAVNTPTRPAWALGRRDGPGGARMAGVRSLRIGEAT